MARLSDWMGGGGMAGLGGHGQIGPLDLPVLETWSKYTSSFKTLGD